MKTRDFKNFLKESLIDGYYPIVNCHGFRNMKPSEIKDVIDGIPELETEASFMELLDLYDDTLSDMEEYKKQWKLIKTAKNKYGENLYGNYQYARNKKPVENEKNIYKTVEKCYNIEYKDKDFTKCKIDISPIKTAMRVTETTHEELAKILTISSRSVDRKMNNETELKAIELLKIMKMFDLTVDDILKEEI